MKPNDPMNWDSLLESFGKITTECNSTDGSLEDLAAVNNVDITQLLFDNPTNIKNNETNNLAVDYDLTGLTLSPFADDKKDSNDVWVDVSILQRNVPLQTLEVPVKREIKSKAMQLALANEIELQAPWVDVSALAASISETPVSIKEKTPESIFTLATFVPTHMQSYIDLNTEITPTANIMTHTSFDLDTPNVLDVGDKVFNDSEIVTNLEPNKLDADLDLFFRSSDDDRSLNTPPPSKVQQKIEINPANSVLFNTDLDLEDTLLFDNEPPSDMYVVRTENIFGKEIAKRNALEQLAADVGICSCTSCKCDPSNGECRECKHDRPVIKSQGCKEDKCSCINCTCDHAEMKCAPGCGQATDSNHNTFLHYHRRHNNCNLEDLGIFTLHECDEASPPNFGNSSASNVINNLKCSCNNSNSNVNNPAHGKENSNCSSKKSCCVTICFKKLDAFKQFLSDNDLMEALRSHNVNLATSSL